MKKVLSLVLVTALFFTTVLTVPPSLTYAAASSSEAPEGDYVEGEILVTFKDDVSSKKTRSIAADLDSKSMEEIPTDSAEDTYLIDLPKQESVEEAIEEYESNPEVESAQPNYLYTLDDSSDTAAAVRASSNSNIDDTDLWNLKKVDTQQAWDLIDDVKDENSEPVTVAVLDTGIDVDHEDLEDALLDPDKCVDVVDSSEPENYKPLLEDKGGHGTKVAGVLAATSHNGKGVAGVASGNHNDLVKLVGVNVFTYSDTSTTRKAKTSDIIKGIEYACSDEINAKVINMSLGLSSSQTDTALHDAVINARNQGVTLVASGGNNGNTMPWYCSDYDEVIGVISTIDYDNIYEVCKAPSSGYGPQKQLSAPGHLIKTTLNNGGYTAGNTSSGTSFAAPVVAGVAAMLYYIQPTITPDEVENILTSTATDLYTEGVDIYTGHGNVNAYSAVAKAANVSIDNSPDPIKAPTKLVAKSTNYNSIQLSWGKVTDADKYHIYRASSKNGNYQRIKILHGNSNTMYTDSGLTTGTAYYYKVRAFGTIDNKKSYGLYSTAVSVTPQLLPSNSLKLSSTSVTKIKLTWSRVSGASGYSIHRASSQKGAYQFVRRITKGTITTHTTSKLKPGSYYYYKIRPYRTVNGKRVYGPYSTVKKIKTTPAQTTIKIKKNSRTRKATITWAKKPQTSGYCIYRAYSANGKYKKIGTKKASSKASFTTKRLKKKKNYYYKVRAFKTYNGKRIYGPYSTVKKCRI